MASRKLAEAANSLAFSTSLTSKKRNTSFGFSTLRNKRSSFNPASLRAGKWASYADFHREKFETLWRTRRWGMNVFSFSKVGGSRTDEKAYSVPRNGSILKSCSCPYRIVAMGRLGNQ